MTKLKENIFSIGVLNPDIRMSDIIIPCPYGTTYNAYLVKGSEKTALIDTVHEGFEESYFKDINEIVGIDKVNYLIVNHSEPDHTGIIEKLIEKNPNIEIYCTSASNIFVKQITNNQNIKFHVIKEGETLSLGDKTLEFHPAPFLHWPDSMFTLVKEDKVLFTCDFLGCHYCENEIIDTKLTSYENYLKSMRSYFVFIFGPFKPHVLNGLSIIKKLAPDTICPSHGPILTTEKTIAAAMDNYDKWAQETDVDLTDIVPIFYVSAYGYTESIAQTLYEEMKVLGKKPVLVNLTEYDRFEINPVALLNGCKEICIGSPTINRNALQPVIDLLKW
ncbi:MAG: FprA family A-type flavoprotein, partial [Malacoplasma sp.]|nr:FprA family A-type flavoprotein [Malacoplasma sp.]